MTLQPARFARKPSASEIEAVQFDGTAECASAVLRWTNASHITATAPNGITDPNGSDWQIVIRLNGDTMTAYRGDWIARGWLGQFYVIPDDILTASYEPASLSTDTAAPQFDVDI